MVSNSEYILLTANLWIVSLLNTTEHIPLDLNWSFLNCNSITPFTTII